MNLEAFWGLLELHGIKLSQSEKNQACFKKLTINPYELDNSKMIDYKNALKYLAIDMASAREGDEKWVVIK